MSHPATAAQPARPLALHAPHSAQRPSQTVTTADALVHTLLLNGIDTVFGLPGLHNDPLFDAFYRAKNRLRLLHPRHEQSTADMALGAALATGRPQVCAVVPGPGFLNASAALLTAQGMNAPVLALVGQIPQTDIDRGHGHLHEIDDQRGLAAHFSKFAARISRPADAPRPTMQALESAMSGLPGPVFLECAMDVWGQSGSVTLPTQSVDIDRPPIDQDAIEQAAKVLGSAKRPLIVLGGGAQAPVRRSLRRRNAGDPALPPIAAAKVWFRRRIG